MSLRQAAQQALEALIPLANANCPNERECLTDEDHERAAEAVEALHAALAEPEQEPVAWWNGRETAWFEHELMGTNPPIENAIPLFTAPTPRRPLTDEEMRECAQSMNAEPLAEGWPELIKFARAIERAHGIGEQHEAG